MSQEIWKPIEWSRNFQVSDLGRVKSLERKVRLGKHAFRTVPEKILRPVIKGTGYAQVSLNNKPYLVHRLVASAFCAGFFHGAQVNHKNGVRSDNTASNLEWVTVSENIKHAFRDLDRKGTMLGKFSGDHSTSKAVARISKSGDIKVYAAAMDAVREGFRSDCISRCCTGKLQSHAGYRWEFAE